MSSSTASEAWEKLTRAYSCGSRSQICNLRSQLHNIQRGSDDITTYLLKAKGIYDKLGSLGYPKIEDDLIDAILMGLGEQYETFKYVMEAKLESIRFDDIFGLLLTAERQLTRPPSSTQAVPPTAMNAARTTTGRGSRGAGRGYVSNS